MAGLPHPRERPGTGRSGALKSEGARKGLSSAKRVAKGMCPLGSQGVGVPESETESYRPGAAGLVSATSRKQGTVSQSHGEASRPSQRGALNCGSGGADASGRQGSCGVRGRAAEGLEGPGRRSAGGLGAAVTHPVRAGSGARGCRGLAAGRAGTERAADFRPARSPRLRATRSRQPLLCGRAPDARGACWES